VWPAELSVAGSFSCASVLRARGLSCPLWLRRFERQSSGSRAECGRLRTTSVTLELQSSAQIHMCNNRTKPKASTFSVSRFWLRGIRSKRRWSPARSFRIQPNLRPNGSRASTTPISAAFWANEMICSREEKLCQLTNCTYKIDTDFCACFVLMGLDSLESYKSSESLTGFRINNPFLFNFRFWFDSHSLPPIFFDNFECDCDSQLVFWRTVSRISFESRTSCTARASTTAPTNAAV
jgi:hypothetical protein